MTFPQGICDHAIDALKTKRLQPRDLAVLMALLGSMNWRSVHEQHWLPLVQDWAQAAPEEPHDLY